MDFSGCPSSWLAPSIPGWFWAASLCSVWVRLWGGFEIQAYKANLLIDFGFTYARYSGDFLELARLSSLSYMFACSYTSIVILRWVFKLLSLPRTKAYIRNMCEMVLLFYWVGPGDWKWGCQGWWQVPYPWRHLTGSKNSFLYWINCGWKRPIHHYKPMLSLI